MAFFSRWCRPWWGSGETRRADPRSPSTAFGFRSAAGKTGPSKELTAGGGPISIGRGAERPPDAALSPEPMTFLHMMGHVCLGLMVGGPKWALGGPRGLRLAPGGAGRIRSFTKRRIAPRGPPRLPTHGRGSPAPPLGPAPCTCPASKPGPPGDGAWERPRPFLEKLGARFPEPALDRAPPLAFLSPTASARGRVPRCPKDRFFSPP